MNKSLKILLILILNLLILLKLGSLTMKKQEDLLKYNYLFLGLDGNKNENRFMHIKEGELTQIEITNKIDRNIEFFHVSKNIICICNTNKIFYYDLNNKIIIKELVFEYDVYATKINNQKDLYILVDGKIYKYNYEEDNVKLVNELYSNYPRKYERYNPDSKIIFPHKNFGNKISYSKKRNSLFFCFNTFETNHNYIRVFELSLSDYQITPRFIGENPIILEKTNNIYYINSLNQKEIMVADLDTFKQSVYFKYKKIIGYFVVKHNGTLLFSYARNLPDIFLFVSPIISKTEHKHILKMRIDNKIVPFYYDSYYLKDPFDFWERL